MSLFCFLEISLEFRINSDNLRIKSSLFVLKPTLIFAISDWILSCNDSIVISLWGEKYLYFSSYIQQFNRTLYLVDSFERRCNSPEQSKQFVLGRGELFTIKLLWLRVRLVFWQSGRIIPIFHFKATSNCHLLKLAIFRGIDNYFLISSYCHYFATGILSLAPEENKVVCWLYI